jgi:hypothetical protein
MIFRNLLIVVAIFGLGWGASFAAGTAYARRSVPQVQAAAATGGQFGQVGQFGQGAQGAQGGGQAGQGRGIVFGTVDHVDGKTLYLAGANGQQEKVTLTDQTQILKQAPGSVADLTAGARVTVQPQGQPAADGTVTAAAVQIVPEGAAPGGQGGQGQAPGGQRQQGGGQRQPGQQSGS